MAGVNPMSFGGLNSMWVIVLFDLPTETPEERKSYQHFRNFLLDDGFTMMQYSVYMRHTPSDENAAVHIARVKSQLPDEGEVRIIKITDKQFGKIQVFYGEKRKPIEQAPEQLLLF
jgi:CRISPR-associated protein Cas2